MKRTFKILSLIMVAVILLTASAISVSAGELPDGGQITNCGESYAYGRTSGGSIGKLHIECQVGVIKEANGDGVVAVMYTMRYLNDDPANRYSLYSTSCTATQNVVAWSGSGNSWTKISDYTDTETYMDGGEFMTIMYNTAGTVDKGTAGHQISVSGYGSWIAGTTQYPGA